MYKSTVFIVLLLSLSSARAGLSRLEALSMIESGNNDFAVGGAGEVSRYQIKPKIWRVYSVSRTYQNQSVSSWVAGQYLAFLENTFAKQAGRSASDFDLYVLWNAGLNYYKRIGFSARLVRPIIRERARRYVNLRLKQDLRPQEVGSQAKWAGEQRTLALKSL